MRPADADVTIAPGELVPAIIQDETTGDVLMLAYMDAEALDATRATGLAHFHSRSRDELWQKGATSGNTMRVSEILGDCDADTILVRVRPAGPACHTGEETCFGPRRGDVTSVLPELARVFEERRREGGEGSYVAGVLAAERETAQRKVGEEAVEVLLAPPGSPELVAEVADLWFHSMVLLARDGLDPLAPLAELQKRRK